MSARPRYAILGNGRWAGILHGILAGEGQATVVAGTRRQSGESEQEYLSRIGASLDKTGARVVWICVPPSPNTPLLAAAAVENGLDVIAEKPWLWAGQASQHLAARARAKGVLIGVHYEYCLLQAVESWRRQYGGGAGLSFGGRFTTGGPDRLGIPAIENLGSHLFAIQAYAAPEAGISGIDCGYNQDDQRRVFLAEGSRQVAEIDFLGNREPIIQRFQSRFEAALEGAPFPFTLGFAARVLETLRAFQNR